jgi:hypothetical protein
MIRFCARMTDAFRYEEGKQSFQEQVIHATVAHACIAMIHPFGDGNGRTARLIEFYTLLLKGVLDIVRANLLEMSWYKFIYDTLDSKKATGKTHAIVKRQRTLALQFPVDQWYTPNDLVVTSGILAKEYATLSPATLLRDLAELERLELIVKNNNRYKGNIEIMHGYLPMRKVK